MTRSCLAALLTLSLPVAMTQVAAQQPPAPKAPKAPPATSATKMTGGARTVALTGGDDMKFSVTEITAKPGETIHIQLKNIGTIPKMAMAHNVVVLKPTTKVVDFNTAFATGPARPHGIGMK